MPNEALIVVDLQQTSLIEDGVYLFDLPGLVLKEVATFPPDWLLVTGSKSEATSKLSGQSAYRAHKMRRRELLGAKYPYKLIGRAVLVERRL